MLADKKAHSIDEYIPFFIFLFVATGAILFVPFQGSAKAQEFQDESATRLEAVQAEEHLLLFMRQSPTHESSAFLAEKAYHYGDYGLFYERAKTYFDPIYDNRWVLELEDAGGNVVYSATSAISRQGGRLAASSTREKQGEISIPINNPGGGSTLTLSLFTIG